MTGKDYYRILGVEKNVTAQRIKEAYRGLAFEYHPDRNHGNAGAVEKMKELNEAYAVLSDPEKKRRYDSLRESYGSDAYDRFRQSYSEQDIFRGSDINQVFEEMARRFGFRRFEDVFRDSYGQGYRTFEFRRPGVFGKGFIFFGFPPGRQYWQRIPPQPGMIPGILGRLTGYLLKKMLQAPEGAQEKNRHAVIILNPNDASRGAKVSYVDRETSRQFIITVPRGIKEGQTIRLKGAGENSAYRGRIEDLYLKVQFRKSLSQKAKDFYKRLMS